MKLFGEPKHFAEAAVTAVTFQWQEKQSRTLKSGTGNTFETGPVRAPAGAFLFWGKGLDHLPSGVLILVFTAIVGAAKLQIIRFLNK